jgi:hypothetical protein
MQLLHSKQQRNAMLKAVKTSDEKLEVIAGTLKQQLNEALKATSESS